MVTLFEVWNGASVYWNGMSWPQFVFPYPSITPQELAFLQLSGRICELQTQAEWALNVGGTLYDIPNLPAQELQSLVLGIQGQLGYAPKTVPYFLGGLTLPLLVWIDLRTGRADTFTPTTGLQMGQQHLMPQPQAASFVAPMGMAPNAPGFATQPQAQAATKPSAQPKTVLEQIATISTSVGKVADFLKAAIG